MSEMKKKERRQKWTFGIKKSWQVFDMFGLVPYFAALFCFKLSEGLFCVELRVIFLFMIVDVLHEIEG